MNTNKHVKLLVDLPAALRFMPRAEMIRLMTFLQYHHDLALRAFEERFGIETDPATGAPVIPYDLPDGVDWPETVLTREAA